MLNHRFIIEMHPVSFLVNYGLAIGSDLAGDPNIMNTVVHFSFLV